MGIANAVLVSALQRIPKTLVKPVAMRYIAGERLGDAVRVVRALNTRNMTATVDVLGENVTTGQEAMAAVQAAEEVLRKIETEGLKSNISIKLTQFGINLDESFCRENVRRLLRLARQYNNFVYIDMEDSSLTSPTLLFYENLRDEGFGNVGAVIQAYLRRTMEDVKKLVKKEACVRVVKGIYVEGETIAYKGPGEIRENYLKILRSLLEGGCYTAIATHDEYLVEGALRFIRDLKVPPASYEFQMLYGVREKLRDDIVAQGHPMRIYVPFGEQWYPYSMRRFQENPQMARYVLRAFLLRD
ncbi:MAG TPA: proline dehydrogenase family protein [Thermodesulfobacteriota bacterium]|nr:proline dehydrogenase family protein [Thermodesulfobacteriota bacterium]